MTVGKQVERNRDKQKQLSVSLCCLLGGGGGGDGGGVGKCPQRAREESFVDSYGLRFLICD